MTTAAAVRVKFSSPWQGHLVGDVVDLDKDTARMVVAGGYAQKVDEDAPIVTGARAVMADYATLQEGEVLVWRAAQFLAEGVDPASLGLGGGTGGPETDPVATAALNTHKTANDPHGDRAAAATDAAAKVTAHKNAADPHGDRADTTSKIAAHVGGADPHGDRAYVDTRVSAITGAPPAALDTLQEIAAQMASDESGAAAMLASINGNATAIADHLAAIAAAHAASAISFDDTGLIVAKGANVKAALAAIDAWTQTRTLAGLTDVNVAGIIDGQLMAWQAATGKFVPVAPSGMSEIDYAENATGVVTGPVAGVSNGYNANPVAIPNTDIIVPPTSRPVYLDAWALGMQMVAGAGQAILEIWETTGAPVVLDRASIPMPNNNANIARNINMYHQPVKLGDSVPAQRTFQLRLNCYGIGATPSVQVANTNAVGFKTWLRAMAG